MHLLKILFFLPLLLLPLATLTFAPQGIAAQPSGLPTETPTKSTDAIKNENCFKCHFESENEKVHTPAAKISTDVHGMAGLTCSSCHGGNPNALQGRDAHKDNFTTNPSPAAISKLCGKCHEKPLASWLTGPHGRLSKQPRQPDCVTCHGAHGIARASVELIGDPLCSSCHPIAQARRIYKALYDAETSLNETHTLLSTASASTQEKLGDFDSVIKSTRSNLRGLAHGLDLFAITRQASEAIKASEEIKAKALPRMGGLKWGAFFRWAGIVVGALFALLGVMWTVRFLWHRRHHVPLPKGRDLKILLIAGSILGLTGLVIAWRGFHYIEHDPKFCTSCHTMGAAFTLWEKSAHKNVECHACHKADIASNLHQLWFYTTRRPDEVSKHAFVDKSTCLSCHTKEGNKSKWNQIMETGGHKFHVGQRNIECIQCHAVSVHKFRPKEDLCVGCHKTTTLAAAGKMAEMHCLQCHNFTVADAKMTLRPDRSACLECHESMKIKQEVFPKDAPMQWACGECHKPHKKMIIGKNDCKGCHADVKKGIHSISSHTECLDCHKPHAWKIKDRKTCEACHSDREKHNPGVICAECHNAKTKGF